MEELDRFFSYLAFARRSFTHLLDVRNLRYSHLLFRGFTPEKGHYYDFKKYGYRPYVTDITRYLKTTFINYNNRDLIKDKYGCYLMLKEFTDKVVPVYGLIDNGVLHLLNKYKTTADLFTAENKFILKPRMGRGGKGVILVTVEGGKVFVDRKQCNNFSTAIKNLKNYILVPYVHPHPYSKKIFPHSLNTIRFLTALVDGKGVLLKAGHRFGADGQTCVDNVAFGGISGSINVNTGIIEDALMIDSKNKKKISVRDHPVTGQNILGLQIPGWQRLKEQVLQIHESIPFITYVGWDIALTEEDFRIIEANYASDLDGIQAHSPMLTDEQNKAFFSKL